MSVRDLPHSLDLERYIIKSILTQEGEMAGRFLAVLTEHCPPPFHRWFHIRDHRFISIAFDGALRGEHGADATSIAEVLRQMSVAEAAQYISGKVSRWTPRTDLAMRESALISIGGHNVLIDGQSLSTSNLKSFIGNCRLLRNYANARAGIEALRSSAERLYTCDPHIGPGAILGQLAAALSALTNNVHSDRDVGTHLLDFLIEHDRQQKAKAEGQATDAVFGVPSLDRLVRLAPGTLTVLGAPPGGGKTSLAWQAAASTASLGDKPGSVCYVSLEMAGCDLAAILAGRKLGISPSAIREGAISPERRQEIEDLATTWRASGNLWVRDTNGGSFTVDQLAAWVRQRQAVAGGTLALLVVDYLQLINGADPRQSEKDRITDQTRRLKTLALELRIPILVLSQLTREGRKGVRDHTGVTTALPEPRLEDLRGSGSIEQDADAVVMLHIARESVNSTLPIEAIVAKNRRGPKGRVPLVFNRRRQEFTDAGPQPTSAPRALQTMRDDDREDAFHPSWGKT